jgi:hypothetical protein
MSDRKQGISLDEFLTTESEKRFLCIIEPVPGHSEKIKVAPWLSELQGCSCGSSFVVDKSAVESVVLTGQSTVCCGKIHKLVEAHFVEHASVKVTDLIEAATRRASEHDHGMPLRMQAPTPGGPPVSGPVNVPTATPFAQSGGFGGFGGFGPTLPSCHYEKRWVVCGSPLPGYPAPMCYDWVYVCTFPGGLQGTIF